MDVLIGGERFGILREAFRRRGHDAWSCDLVPAVDGSRFHLQMDMLVAARDYDWDLAIFHPDCTYLTISAAWAYGDGPYHQNIQPGTLVGARRREARDEAIAFVKALAASPVPAIAIENPIGTLSKAWRKPDQIIQPHQFGDDASKATCLWLQNLPPLVPTMAVPPRMVDGRPRWSNQTDSGQNRLSPSPERAMARAETYPGIATAMAAQWGR